ERDEPNAVVLQRVTLAYGEVRALDGVSFRVPKGSITGLIGRNGAGKSTTIRMLAGILAPGGDQSDVRVMGLRPVEEKAAVLAQSGFLLSDTALFSYLTAAETLHFVGRACGLDAATAVQRT